MRTAIQTRRQQGRSCRNSRGVRELRSGALAEEQAPGKEEGSFVPRENRDNWGGTRPLPPTDAVCQGLAHVTTNPRTFLMAPEPPDPCAGQGDFPPSRSPLDPLAPEPRPALGLSQFRVRSRATSYSATVSFMKHVCDFSKSRKGRSAGLGQRPRESATRGTATGPPEGGARGQLAQDSSGHAAWHRGLRLGPAGSTRSPTGRPPRQDAAREGRAHIVLARGVWHPPTAWPADATCPL